jgi:Aspartyl/Asparaginyl beta-hydroxylase
LRISLLKASAFDVSAIQQELSAHPDVWNTIKHRTEHPMSPHREVDDVWMRYNPIENYHGDMQRFNDEHTPEWYPVADKLPAVKVVSEALFKQLKGEQLGAVLITRIPAGRQVYPHVDGGWHARTFDKFCVTIRGNHAQAFCFDGEELRTGDGDFFWFDNAYPHWVKNDSAEDRISLIVCVRGAICH